VDVPLVLELAAEAGGERVAVGSRSSGTTYRSLRERAGRAASWIVARETRTLALVAENADFVPVALFGSALARVPFAPLNYRLADDRLSALLATLAPGVAIVDANVSNRVEQAGVELVSPGSFLREVERSAPDGEVPGDIEDVALTLFTSGTTGEPKAAVLRHRNLAAYVIGSVDLMSAGEDEAALMTTPPYHVAGVVGILTAVYAGRRIVFLPSFDPAAWIDIVRRESITHAMVVPTMLGRILDALGEDADPLPGLRHLSYGGGPMPPAVVERALERLPHVDFVNAYGLTETSSTIAILAPGEHREAISSDDPAARRRLRSVGRPLPSVRVAILDEDGAEVGPGVWGEVAVRGEQVACETVDEWFRTRDRGMLDGDGFLYLDGRLDDVIVRGGENLSPGVIEEALLEHPAVKAAAVVAAPSPEWGEEPVAFVVATGVDEDELKAWVRARLRSASTPTAIHFRDELPYSATGKLLRRELRAALAR
jgi:acyl-CoA synthetase (AMP-forming)/AMP-acid ligase II